jgi:hypothetical protein
VWQFSGDQSVKDIPKEGLTSKTVDRWELVDGTWYRQFKHVKTATPKDKAGDGGGRKDDGSPEQKKETDEKKDKKATGDTSG